MQEHGCEEFLVTLPRCIDLRTASPPFRNEKEFQIYIRKCRELQHRLGWDAVVKDDAFFPDLIVSVEGELCYVELEYDATRFIKHHHYGVMCDLVLSFRRPDGLSSVCGKPVWSLYRHTDGILEWTLDDDICGTRLKEAASAIPVEENYSPDVVERRDSLVAIVSRPGNCDSVADIVDEMRSRGFTGYDRKQAQRDMQYLGLSVKLMRDNRRAKQNESKRTVPTAAP
jgi:hypothetical protein